MSKLIQNYSKIDFQSSKRHQIEEKYLIKNIFQLPQQSVQRPKVSDDFQKLFDNQINIQELLKKMQAQTQELDIFNAFYQINSGFTINQQNGIKKRESIFDINKILEHQSIFQYINTLTKKNTQNFTPSITGKDTMENELQVLRVAATHAVIKLLREQKVMLDIINNERLKLNELLDVTAIKPEIQQLKNYLNLTSEQTFKNFKLYILIVIKFRVKQYREQLLKMKNQQLSSQQVNSHLSDQKQSIQLYNLEQRSLIQSFLASQIHGAQTSSVRLNKISPELLDQLLSDIKALIDTYFKQKRYNLMNMIQIADIMINSWQQISNMQQIEQLQRLIDLITYYCINNILSKSVLANNEQETSVETIINALNELQFGKRWTPDQIQQLKRRISYLQIQEMIRYPKFLISHEQQAQNDQPIKKNVSNHNIINYNQQFAMNAENTESSGDDYCTDGKNIQENYFDTSQIEQKDFYEIYYNNKLYNNVYDVQELLYSNYQPFDVKQVILPSCYTDILKSSDLVENNIKLLKQILNIEIAVDNDGKCSNLINNKIRPSIFSIRTHLAISERLQILQTLSQQIDKDMQHQLQIQLMNFEIISQFIKFSQTVLKAERANTQNIILICADIEYLSENIHSAIYSTKIVENKLIGLQWENYKNTLQQLKKQCLQRFIDMYNQMLCEINKQIMNSKEMKKMKISSIQLIQNNYEQAKEFYEQICAQFCQFNGKSDTFTQLQIDLRLAFKLHFNDLLSLIQARGKKYEDILAKTNEIYNKMTENQFQ